MTEFDVARIVPSLRDFAGAVRTQLEGLALVPVVAGDVAGDVESTVLRLEGLDVRALAVAERGEPCLLAARASRKTPLLLQTPAESARACQEARFFGADAVLLSVAHFDELRKTAQSMRMMPVALATDRSGAQAAVGLGARVLILAGDLSAVLHAAEGIDRSVITVADVTHADSDALRALSGSVHAALVPRAVHEREDFAALLDELDA